MLVYLDNAATTKQYGEIGQVLMKINEENYGNPSSLHKMGFEAEQLLKKARQGIASSLSCSPNELIFTASGTEADNLALFGFYQANYRKGKKIITSLAEHPAVLGPCKVLEDQGAKIEYLNIDEYGNIDLSQLEDVLDEESILVSLIHVNNELGTISPLNEVKKIIKRKSEAVLHSDSVQAFGKIPVRLGEDEADMVSISSHKIHGPKGVGALAVKRGIRLTPSLYGGGQERGLRPGTENLPGLYGFSMAAERMMKDREDNEKKLHSLRNYLHKGILEEIEDVRVNTPMENSSPSILNVSFLGCMGEVLLHYLEEHNIFVSTGAACSSKKGGSGVLWAAGLPEEVTNGAIRFSFSSFNQIQEIDYVLVRLKEAVKSIRKITRRK